VRIIFEGDWENWHKHFGENLKHEGMFKVTTSKGFTSMRATAEGAFSCRLTSRSAIITAFMGTVRTLGKWASHSGWDEDQGKRVEVSYPLKIVEIVMLQKDIDKIVTKVEAIDQGHRVVKVEDDLTLSCGHPEFSGLSLKGWKGYSKKQLVHPIYWQDDAKAIQTKFTLKITKSVERRFEKLMVQEQIKNEMVHVRESSGGYSVFVYPLQEEIMDRINSVVTVDYNRMRDDGTYAKEKMKFVKALNVKAVTYLPAEEGEEPQVDPASVQPEEFHELDAQGYKPYEAAMFTLPAMEQFLKRRGVQVTGMDDIYPDFPNFDFPVTRVQDNQTYRDMPFQDEAFKSWEDSGMLGTIALPTGSGKTLIALRAIAKLKVRTLIVTPTIEMLHQWRRMIVQWLEVPEEKVGLYYSGSKDIRDITIITFQSGHRRVTQETEDVSGDVVDDIIRLSEQAGLMIMDEGHHAPAPVFQRIMINMKSRWRMSLTATPYREDSNEALAFLALGEVVVTKDYASLAEEGVVSPIKYQMLRTPYTEAEERMIEIKAEFQIGKHLPSAQWYSNSGRDKATLELLELWAEHPWTVLRNAGRKEDKQVRLEEPRDVPVRHLAYYAEGKWLLLRSIMDRHKDSKVLVFNEFVEGAKVIAKYIQDNCPGMKVEAMTGSTSPTKRKSIFNDFQSSDSMVLVTTTVLDEGIDVPDCDVVVIFNGSRSKRQMIQRVGRGCRFRPGKIEYVYELIAAPDNAGEGRSKNGTRYYSRGTADKDVIARMRAKRKDGGRTGYQHGVGYGDDAESMATREILLYEWEVADYRSIADIIQPERQQELIDAMEGS